MAFRMTNFNPQRAKGTHRAKGALLLPTGKNIASSLFKDSLPRDSHVAPLLRMTESALHAKNNFFSNYSLKTARI